MIPCRRTSETDVVPVNFVAQSMLFSQRQLAMFKRELEERRGMTT